ncbi:MAG: transketolase C-terminal domain-containing protein [Candidatus Woesebacteria bacterium]|nr:transketolase C-terminal domain-containing protein [Candidatus Woesebacteria bacterium]
MVNKKMFLSDKIFKKDIELKLMRDGFGYGLLEAGEKDERIVVLTADLKESTRVNYFAEKFPNRFIEVGVAEQNLVTIASGMANYGKIPFCTSYAIFSPGRNWEQIRTTIGIDGYPVKIIGAQSGLNIGHYGVTHQALEDIALMRVIPNMNVIAPSDYNEAKKATLSMAVDDKPYYMRLPRIESPVYTTDKTPFMFGKANVLTESKKPEVIIIATGLMVYEALLAYKELERNGIETIVINVHTIKPLDTETIIRYAKLTGAVVTIEEHQVIGGLGSAVSETLSKNFPVPIEILGVQDRFGQSGKPKELFKEYGLTKEDIAKAVKKVIARKNS